MTPFDRREALRYMGVRGAPDAGVQALVEEAAHLLEPRAHYRVLLQRLPLDWTGGLSLDGIPLPGESIRRCMRGCGGSGASGGHPGQRRGWPHPPGVLDPPSPGPGGERLRRRHAGACAERHLPGAFRPGGGGGG